MDPDKITIRKWWTKCLHEANRAVVVHVEHADNSLHQRVLVQLCHREDLVGVELAGDLEFGFGFDCVTLSWLEQVWKMQRRPFMRT